MRRERERSWNESNTENRKDTYVCYERKEEENQVEIMKEFCRGNFHTFFTPSYKILIINDYIGMRL